MDHKGNICITGASKGIGYALALYLADAGYKILAVSRSREGLERLEEARPGRVRAIPMDLTRVDAGEKVREAIEGEGVKGLDGLVNNAGYLIRAPFDQVTDQDWREIMEVNIMGVVRMCRELHPLLKNGERAHIVNIGSMAGFQGSVKFPGMVAYSTTKAALVGLTEGLASEWSEAGIRVNCLALGAVDTEMFREAFPEGSTEVTPERMAKFIGDLVMDGGEVMSGQVIPVSLSTP